MLARLRWWLAWCLMTRLDRYRIWYYFMFWQRVAQTLPRRLGKTWWRETNDWAAKQTRDMIAMGIEDHEVRHTDQVGH